jgi:hypothetical protein
MFLFKKILSRLRKATKYRKREKMPANQEERQPQGIRTGRKLLELRATNKRS